MVGSLDSLLLVYLLSFLVPYLIGSIPFGLLLTRAGGLGDVRSIGSGNIGATNVLRTGNKVLAAATLLLDVAKGFLAVLLVRETVGEDLAGIAALAAVLGHCFPIWLRFKGGKGVATALGVCLSLGWPIGVTYAVVWLALLAITRTSSLAGMSAAVAAPVAAAMLDRTGQVWALAAITLIVVWLHRENIARLRAGTEPRVGAKG